MSSDVQVCIGLIETLVCIKCLEGSNIRPFNIQSVGIQHFPKIVMDSCYCALSVIFYLLGRTLAYETLIEFLVSYFTIIISF